MVFSNTQVVLQKKEAEASFLRFKACVKYVYFTTNFMVFSKPLAFTVTK